MFLIVNTPKNYKNTFDQVDLLIIIDQFETRQVAVRGFLCWGSRQLKSLGTSWVMESAETKLLESNLESKSDFVQFGRSSFVSRVSFRLVSFQQKCCHRFKPVKSGWFWWTAATPTRRQQEQEQLGQADGWLVLRLLMALRQLTHWQFVPWQLVPYLCNTTTRPQGVRGACPLVRAQRQMTWLG